MLSLVIKAELWQNRKEKKIQKKESNKNCKNTATTTSPFVMNILQYHSTNLRNIIRY